MCPRYIHPEVVVAHSWFVFLFSKIHYRLGGKSRLDTHFRPNCAGLSHSLSLAIHSILNPRPPLTLELTNSTASTALAAVATRSQLGRRVWAAKFAIHLIKMDDDDGFDDDYWNNFPFTASAEQQPPLRPRILCCAIHENPPRPHQTDPHRIPSRVAFDGEF